MTEITDRNVSPKSWWRNCAIEADDEIRRIDRMEDEIAPISSSTAKIRELISSLELCHHKASRWVNNILEAIATGKTAKGLGTRPDSQFHPVEGIWQDACNALSQWIDGKVNFAPESCVGKVPAAQLFSGLGERSPLKEWQVQRVIERIRSLIQWPKFDDNPETKYNWLLLSGGEYESAYLSDCPACYKDHEDFWLTTSRTIIHDTDHGLEAKLSLALAIDMLWPCHWNFVGNLQLVLDAIGGRLRPEKPFTACGRNITLVPGQDRCNRITATLNNFSGQLEITDVVKEILDSLGEPTDEKRWLAASLAKTIQLQLNPSPSLREACSLAGPEWILCDK